MARVITLVPLGGIGPEVNQGVVRVLDSTADFIQTVRGADA